jgi:hypothetical protein
MNPNRRIFRCFAQRIALAQIMREHVESVFGNALARIFIQQRRYASIP